MCAALAVALLVGAGGPLLAQPTIDPRSAGNTYVFAIPDTANNSYDSRQDTDPRFTKRVPLDDSVFVAIYSAVDNDVRITGYGGYSTRVTVPAGTIQTVYLNGSPRASAPIVDESGAVNGKTFRIEAVDPIIVYCFVATKFGAEAFTPAPVASWGTEYYAAALPGEVLYNEIPGGENNYGKNPKAGPSEILVVAAFDNTRVTIVPNARLDRNPPTTVTLMKDQCYQVQSYVDTTSFNLGNPQPDIGGSYIYATRPIGVISGNTRAQVIDINGGLAKNSFKNMMIEWLPPTDQHGTKFVYMPTWDDVRPTGAPSENPDVKRPGEIIRVYATAGRPDDESPTVTSVSDLDGSTGNVVGTSKIDRARFFALQSDGKTPHVFATDRPAQAFMSTAATVQFMGTTGGGNFVGSTYQSLATYMVELVPEERWTWTAPYIAPDEVKMNSFMNIVTDSSSRNKITIGDAQVLINRPIAGTPYYWGTRTLNRGETGVIQGADSSVRFSATIYGEMIGLETYRPGKTRKGGDGSETGGATDRRSGMSNSQVLHPSEYEENIGLMYGYPVAPAHLALRPGDSLSIVTSYDCGILHITITTVSPAPVGLGSIALESADNAEISFITPGSAGDVVGRTSAELRVVPIDPSQPASGIVVIRDRAGKISRERYEWTPGETSLPVVTPAKTLDFGQSPILGRTTKRVVVRNSVDAPLAIISARLLDGSRGFRIDSTSPALPVTIEQGDSLAIFISFVAAGENQSYQDDLRIDYDCGFDQITLRAESLLPCLTMDDLDFGTLKSGTFAAMPLRICNEGGGIVTFEDPLITGLTRTFQVSAADLNLLKKTRLGPNECVTIAVLFHGERIDQYSTVARFWASTRECRDTSVWNARIVPEVLGVDREDAGEGYALVAVEPNPLTATATITFTLGAAGRTTVEIYDAAGARVASLADAPFDAGRHALPWSAGHLPSGIYYCRIRSGAWSATQPVLLVR